MLMRNPARSILVACVLIGCSIAAGRADTCSDMLARFNEAVDAGHDQQAQQLVESISTDALCGRYQIAAQRRLAAFRLDTVQDLMARGRPNIEFEALLVRADAPQVLWQAAATLGEVRFGERRFAEAAVSFDRAIEIVKNETLTRDAPSKFEIEELVDRATQARLLAANGLSGDKKPAFVTAANDRRDGKIGGIYSPSVRGIVAHALPLPITFDYGKASLTTVGQDAASELAKVIVEQQPSKVVIVGHTDVQGDAELNVKLSDERAATVAAFLQQNGVTVPVETLGVGATQPFPILDASGLSKEDIYALDRRVEWRRD
jgi:outer membrane protein OmpA-like peptidoglycan-associated protein